MGFSENCGVTYLNALHLVISWFNIRSRCSASTRILSDRVKKTSLWFVDQCIMTWSHHPKPTLQYDVKVKGKLSQFTEDV